MVELGPGARAWSQPAHRTTSTRLACGDRQGAIVWSRAGSSLDDPTRAGIHDDIVTSCSVPRRLRWKYSDMKRSTAEIVREYGPFPGVDRVNGVTYDGQQVWIAAGDKLNAID